MRISILQNFIVTSQNRLDILTETFPITAKYFNGIPFYVNYNSSVNLESVYSLYDDNVSELSFYNDLTLDWGLIVQSMLSEIDSDCVFIFPEDFIIREGINRSYFDKLMEEMVKYDCDLMFMHRIEDVKCYGTNEKYFSLYDSKEYLHLVTSDKCPTSSLSSVAIYKKDFLNEYLTMYNSQSKSNRFPLATPNAYEWFSHERVSELVKDKLFAVPRRAVLQHYEPYGKERN